MIEPVSAADVVRLGGVMILEERGKVGLMTSRVIIAGLLETLERARLRDEAPARGDRVIARCRARRIHKPAIDTLAGKSALGLGQFRA